MQITIQTSFSMNMEKENRTNGMSNGEILDIASIDTNTSNNSKSIPTPVKAIDVDKEESDADHGHKDIDVDTDDGVGNGNSTALKALEAGEELLEALDDAIAGFEDEDFDFDSSSLLSEDGNNAAAVNACHDAPENRDSPDMNMNISINMDVHDQTTRTSEMYSQEDSNDLSKRVTEWIATAADSHEEKKRDPPISPSSLLTALPTAIEAVPNFVSPLLVREKDFMNSAQKANLNGCNGNGSTNGSTNGSHHYDHEKEKEENGGDGDGANGQNLCMQDFNAEAEAELEDDEDAQGADICDLSNVECNSLANYDLTPIPENECSPGGDDDNDDNDDDDELESSRSDLQGGRNDGAEADSESFQDEQEALEHPQQELELVYSMETATRDGWSQSSEHDASDDSGISLGSLDNDKADTAAAAEDEDVDECNGVILSKVNGLLRSPVGQHIEGTETDAMHDVLKGGTELEEAVDESSDIHSGWDFDDVDSLPSEICNSVDIHTPVPKKISGSETLASSNDDDCDQASSTDCEKEKSAHSAQKPVNSAAAGTLIQQRRSEELAQSNAEDVLSLSLEVQKLKDKLFKEQESNQVVKDELEQEKMKSTELDNEMKRLKREHADAQQTFYADTQELMVECQQTKIKIQMAENDAQEALQLAEESAKSRTEMEGFLQRALDQIEQLRNQKQTLPMIAEDSFDNSISDGDDLMHTPGRRLDRRRIGVSAGRSLLRQAAENDEDSFASTLDGSTGSTNTDSHSYYITLSRKSTEKRQRLINMLKMATEDNHSGKDVVIFPGSDREGLDLNYTNALSKGMKNIANIMRKSGKALGLGGRWFSKKPSHLSKQKGEEELDMQTMAKSYCRSVESIISKQKKELKDLKAFCEYLEGKVAET